MQVSDLHQSNRAAWDQAAARYEAAAAGDIEFLRGGGVNVHDRERPFLAGLKDWCGRAIHLQCAGGTDTLSLWNLGATQVVGVDISPRLIACARGKSDALKAPAQWHACDVLATPEELSGTADLVYTGRGALCFVHDIAAWAPVVARLLKPGGRLYVFERHPLTYIWNLEAGETKPGVQCDQSSRGEPALERGRASRTDYFAPGIDASSDWPASYKLDSVADRAVRYERHWTLGQIINSLIEAGLQMERFEEYPDTCWKALPDHAAGGALRIPQTFSLLMRR